MPVYEPSYRRFDGTRTEGWVRSWALVRNGVGRLLKERRFLFLLSLAWVPAIIRGDQIDAARQFPQAGELLQVSPELWESFLTQQISLLPVVLVALYAGAGAMPPISDREHWSSICRGLFPEPVTFSERSCRCFSPC